MQLPSVRGKTQDSFQVYDVDVFLIDFDFFIGVDTFFCRFPVIILFLLQITTLVYIYKFICFYTISF